jgi:RNA polymerase sigma-70 factor
VTSEHRLVAAFLGEIPSNDRLRFGQGLAAEIETALAQGHAAFPDLALDRETFARHLARAIIRRSDAATLSTLVADDLYLACACCGNVPGAANVFVNRYRMVIERAVARVVGKDIAGELAQGLLADVLVGSGGSPPEISDYSGRGSLAHWLEVVAQRAALGWLRIERARGRAADRAALEPSLDANTPAEVAVFRERYGRAFEQALREVLARAPRRERTILRLSLVEGLSTAKIGKIFGVSQPTAARWLAKARDSVRAGVKSALKEPLALSSQEIESLGALLEGRLDLSISQILGAAEVPEGL